MWVWGCACECRQVGVNISVGVCVTVYMCVRGCVREKESKVDRRVGLSPFRTRHLWAWQLQPGSPAMWQDTQSENRQSSPLDRSTGRGPGDSWWSSASLLHCPGLQWASRALAPGASVTYDLSHTHGLLAYTSVSPDWPFSLRLGLWGHAQLWDNLFLRTN